MCSVILTVSKLNFFETFFWPLRALPPAFWKSSGRRRAAAVSKDLLTSGRKPHKDVRLELFSLHGKSCVKKKCVTTHFLAATVPGRKSDELLFLTSFFIFEEETFSGGCGASPATCFSFCATRREHARLAWYANDSGGSTEPPCWWSAAFWTGRLRQQFFLHEDSSQWSRTVRETEHLKNEGQLQCWAKGCPLSPQERVQLHSSFFTKGV